MILAGHWDNNQESKREKQLKKVIESYDFFNDYYEKFGEIDEKRRNLLLDIASKCDIDIDLSKYPTEAVGIRNSIVNAVSEQLDTIQFLKKPFDVEVERSTPKVKKTKDEKILNLVDLAGEPGSEIRVKLSVLYEEFMKLPSSSQNTIIDLIKQMPKEEDPATHSDN